MTDRPVSTSTVDGVLTVTLSRPDKRNALDRRALTGLRAALDRARTDPDVRAVVLTGAGPVFCAGADIGEYATATPAGFADFTDLANTVVAELAALPKPVVAAVDGPALGGGFELVLAADVAYAADTATFGLPELSLGLIPGWAGTQRLTNALGVQRTLAALWTGRRFGAAEALALGLVTEVCPAESLLPAAVGFARQVGALPPAVLAATKRAVRSAASQQVGPGAAVEREALLRLFADTGQEGIAAFVAKRSPRWAS